MNLHSNDLLEDAKKHQANIRDRIFEENEWKRINNVQKYSLKRRALVVFVATGYFLFYFLIQFMNL